MLVYMFSMGYLLCDRWLQKIMVYYDLWDDPAGLGSDRDSMKVGDMFFYDWKEWIVVEVDTANSRLLIEEATTLYD